MKAIIVAGGKGKRLRPVTDKLPKAMVKVAGRPILEHILNLLKNHGISEFIFSLCYLPQLIISYFGNGTKFEVEIDYVFEKKDTPLGTAGAVLGAKKYIKDTFIVTYADILRELDVHKMVSYHHRNGLIATLAVYKNSSSNPKSIIEFDNNSRVTNFVERPKFRNKKGKPVWSNASFYVLEPEIFEFIPQNQKSDFGKDIFPKVIAAGGKVIAYKQKGYLFDIGDAKKLEKAKLFFTKNRGINNRMKND